MSSEFFTNPTATTTACNTFEHNLSTIENALSSLVVGDEITALSEKISYLKEVLTHQPGKIEALEGLVLTYNELGDAYYDKYYQVIKRYNIKEKVFLILSSIKAFKDSLDINKTLPETQNKLSQAYFLLGNIYSSIASTATDQNEKNDLYIEAIRAYNTCSMLMDISSNSLTNLAKPLRNKILSYYEEDVSLWTAMQSPTLYDNDITPILAQQHIMEYEVDMGGCIKAAFINCLL